MVETWIEIFQMVWTFLIGIFGKENTLGIIFFLVVSCTGSLGLVIYVVYQFKTNDWDWWL